MDSSKRNFTFIWSSFPVPKVLIKYNDVVNQQIITVFFSEGTAVLTLLDEVAEEALAQIGFLSYEVTPPVNTPQAFNMYKPHTNKLLATKFIIIFMQQASNCILLFLVE